MDLQDVLCKRYGPFMDINELSGLLRIKRQSMYQQIYHGRLPIPHAKLGKKYLFPTTEVANYVTDRLNLPGED
jgi:predicted DNA-binding transcriptional regulator AlpA